MASPFIFIPEQEGSASSAYPMPAYHNAYYGTPQAGPTPFLPPATLYPSSPYLGAGGDIPGSPSGSPNPFNPNSVLWPSDAPESAYGASWVPLTPRQRTNSWQGPLGGGGSPFIPPKAPAFLSAQSAYKPWVPGHKKSKSWGNTAAYVPAWVNNNPNPYAPPIPKQQIHPWLNGDAPSPHFHFDLAPNAFMPLRLSAPVGGPELASAAFHPPRINLRILHPRLPFWPIDLALPASRAAGSAPPISLGDVLLALHRALHTRITPTDWETLSAEDAQAVTHAFARRCRAAALRSGVAAVHLRDREVEERNYGVKRVDFLCGKTVFKGLVKAPGDPEGVVRLITG
ncbi:hypothetical protein FB45DRAFT_920848 [Roridomyces roridus]|uniref:DUF6699 domain-containing protein n=1 Tax=Roridomyces roridus TaxID=1738132 RepID=A0AAD7BQ81_9AGAR|nr:hypothetical protein FB45DRAFT_920848 [Roridomyces roridus]